MVLLVRLFLPITKRIIKINTKPIIIATNIPAITTPAIVAVGRISLAVPTGTVGEVSEEEEEKEEEEEGGEDDSDTDCVEVVVSIDVVTVSDDSVVICVIIDDVDTGGIEEEGEKEGEVKV